MIRLINTCRAVAWHSTLFEPTPTESLKEAMDTLLFDIALKGRVPAEEPVHLSWDNLAFPCKENHLSVMCYYVGRAKAMKAYKSGTTSKYHQPNAKIGKALYT